MSTYPQQIAPMAIYSPEVNRTYFTFNMDVDTGAGSEVGHALSYYDHATGLVARPQVWLEKGTGDAHDAPSMAIDGDGYIYLFSNTHGEARQSYIRRSSGPYRINSWVDLLSSDTPADMAVFGNPATNPGSSGNPRFSYGSGWYVPNAEEDEKFLLQHTRYLNGQRDLFTTTSADADTWTPRETFSQIESGQYQTSWIKPDGASVGTIFNVHPNGQGLDWRTDLYYMETHDQAQTWQTIDGLTLVDNRGVGSNPFTSRPDGPGDGAALVYNAAPDERVYLKDVNYDAAGNPVILFLTSPTHLPGDYGAPGPDRFVKTAHWTGANWDIRDVTTTDHNYDHGSLYVEPDGTWRIIAPFIDGPQQYGTGGEVGMWTSADEGANWSLAQQLTSGSNYNHSYVRRPLNAQDDFYAFWADGDAFDPSSVHLYFSNKEGDVFHLPYEFEGNFAAPEPYEVRPFEVTTTVSATYVNSATGGALATLTVISTAGDKTYAAAQLFGAELSAFGGTAASGGTIADVLMPSGTTVAPTVNELRGLLGDSRLDTGLVNAQSWSVAFTDAIQNGEGPDIVLLDWGSADTVDISIAGVTQDDVSPNSTSVVDASMSGRVRFQSIENDVDTLNKLLGAQLKVGPTTSGTQTAYAIDLSDFGFASGASLTPGMEIVFTDGQGVDPTAVFGLPSSYLSGDFNRDGRVDAADYTVWRDGLGDGYSQYDYEVWRVAYGSASSAGQTTPEPVGVFMIAAMMLLSAIFPNRK